jgi:hypothetical protein
MRLREVWPSRCVYREEEHAYMISRDEARQLRGVAELLRGRPSPAVLEQLAILLDAVVAEGVRHASPASPGDRSEPLFPQAESFSEFSEGFSGASEKPESSSSDGSSSTCTASPASPSSSSSVDLKDQEKKTEKRWRPCTDEPIPDDFRAVYETTLAERRLKTPTLEIRSPEFVWAAFLEWLWAKDVSFANKFGGKRKWRERVLWENAITPEASPAPPPQSSSRRVALRPVVAQDEPSFEERREGASALLALVGRPQPEQRSMSA